MQPIDWEQLPYFLAVARAGSLRAAAEVLGTSHVKVSRHLKALESTYGVALVRRTQRGIHLTPAGTQLLPIAEEAASFSPERTPHESMCTRPRVRQRANSAANRERMAFEVQTNKTLASGRPVIALQVTSWRAERPEG